MEKVRLSEPLFLLHIVGMRLQNSDKFSLIRKLLTIVVYILTVGLLFAELFFNYQGIESLARASESLFAQYALAWKITIFVIQKRITGHNPTDRRFLATRRFWCLPQTPI